MHAVVTYIVSFAIGTLFGALGLLFSIAFFVYKKNSITDLSTVEDSHQKQEKDLSAETKEPLTKIGWLIVIKSHGIDVDSYEPEFEQSSLINTLFNKKTQSPLVNSSIPGFKKTKNLYFVVLKNNSLILYDNSKRIQCLGIIPLYDYEVSLYPKNVTDTNSYKKELPIQLQLSLKKKQKTQSLNNLTSEKEEQHSDEFQPKNKTETQPTTKYYLYSQSNSEKEDWFLRLIESQKKKVNSTVKYKKEHLEELIKAIKDIEKENELDWLNALFGRIFLGIYKTEWMKQYFIKKIMSKTNKVKTPSFLGDINVRDLDVGKSTPILSNPRLLNINSNGEINAQIDMLYEGYFKVVVETEATISVSARLKQYKVNLVLALVVKKVQGRMHIKIKQPPTNRVWVGFYEEPVAVIDVEPIVSDKLIKFNLVIQAIKRKIMDTINESIVLPNMDDYCFFPSNGTGGIFDYHPTEDPLTFEKDAEEEQQFARKTKSVYREKEEPQLEKSGDNGP